MIDNRLACVVIAACAVVACAMPTTPAPEAAPLTCNLLEESMTSDEIIIRETTQPTISGHLVGVSNIWERELPDDKGVIVPRLSANLSIMDIATEQTRNEKVFAGNRVSLGGDSYCVVKIEEGESAAGTITLRKIEHPER
ncbi:MAG TPA: hypothetical protein DD379_20190 [Cyanobacteria bacterium UBA11162]|nr:hypothetical protein [Cyanobacteria bacterium UBA11162]